MARTLGLLIWGFIFWMMASLGVTQNDSGGLMLAILILGAVSAARLSNREFRRSMADWLSDNRRVILTIEIVFFLSFAFLAFVRSGNAEIIGTEKPMELAFINAILRSTSFPPNDPWLSGYSISYYYFGYVITSMIAKATGTLGSVAFNLMLALLFALSAIGAYGILFNLLAWWRRGHLTGSLGRPLTGLPLLGPLFLLIVSNFEGFLEVLHSLGVFWKFPVNGEPTSAFWSWLGILDLNQAPAQPLTWMPDRYYWWWRASRVITDFSLGNVHREIIDEFPFFSYLLGDLHPHVLAMPFGLLAVGVALNLFLGGWKGEIRIGAMRVPIHLPGLLIGALVLGGFIFINTWDILFVFALLVSAFILWRVREDGWSLKRAEEGLSLGLPLGILAAIFYLPFLLKFSSQAGGILPNLENPSRGIQLWIMFGPLLLPIFALLLHFWRNLKLPAAWRAGFVLAGALELFLWAFSWVMGLLVKLKLPEFVASYLAGEGVQTVGQFFTQSTIRRFEYMGGWFTLLMMLGMSLAFLFSIKQQWSGDAASDLNQNAGMPRIPLAPFILTMIVIACGLVLAPEFVFLKDQFNNRMNTIFKFYYQAWMLWSLVAAFAVAVLLHELKRIWKLIYQFGLWVVLVMALTYPVMSVITKTESFRLPDFLRELKSARMAGEPDAWKSAVQVWTLDGADYYTQIYPNDMAAAAWLRSAPFGVIVEASKPDASYSDYARFSTYSGLPTVLGWPMHEGQWRGSYEPQGSRQEDIRRLYETTDWPETKAILLQYGIRYVCIGTLERSTYRVNEDKFLAHLVPVFTQGQVTIYELP